MHWVILQSLIRFYVYGALFSESIRLLQATGFLIDPILRSAAWRNQPRHLRDWEAQSNLARVLSTSMRGWQETCTGPLTTTPDSVSVCDCQPSTSWSCHVHDATLSATYSIWCRCSSCMQQSATRCPLCDFFKFEHLQEASQDTSLPVVINGKMVNGSRYYRSLESVSIASALSTALTIYSCQIRVHQTLTV